MHMAVLAGSSLAIARDQKLVGVPVPQGKCWEALDL